MPPDAGAVGIAGLGHEAVDHAMEDDAVVLALARQLLDLGDVLGREVGAHLDDDAAVLEVDVERVFLVHGHSLTSAATRTLIILSGGAATAPEPGAPFLILSTQSMPDTTLPHTRVLAVEEVRILEDDEELAARAVGIGGARHRDGAAHVRLLAELGGQRVAHAAHAGAVRIAGLGHEAVDHAVEDDAVVLALARQLLDLGDVLGGEVGAHLDDDAAIVLEVDVECVFLVGGGGDTSRREKDSGESQNQTHDGSP